MKFESFSRGFISPCTNVETVSTTSSIETGTRWLSWIGAWNWMNVTIEEEKSGRRIH
jgi:hypothetical protein